MTIERRVHRVYVTRTTEYHLRGTTCVAVKDRRTGRPCASHLALRARLSGSVRGGDAGIPVTAPDAPDIGDQLLFRGSGRDLVSAPVLSIERPSRPTVSTYAW